MATTNPMPSVVLVEATHDAPFRPLAGPQFGVDRVVLGCAPSAGLYGRSTSEDDVVRLLTHAASRGVTKLDTAPLYGCGQSEIDIGRAFRRDPKALEGVTVATKVGRVTLTDADTALAALRANPSTTWRVEEDTGKYYALDRDTANVVCVVDYSADGVQRSYAQSCERLTDAAATRVRTLRIHDAESAERVAMLTQGTAVDALRELRASKTIDAIGLGMNQPRFILEILRAYPPGTFDNVLMAGAYNLIDASGAEVLAECRARGVQVHIAGIFGAGLLWGGTKYRYADADKKVCERRDQLQAVCAAYNVSLPWLAVHFATRPSCVTHVVFGCRTAEELDGCLELVRPESQPTQEVLTQLYAELCKQDLLPLGHGLPLA